MPKRKFIHTADWHILDSQYGKKFRGRDSREAVMQIVDYAISQKVDFILNSGDILDKNRPSETMLDFLFEVHERLREAGIPMYSITGNHDASDPSFLNFPGKGKYKNVSDDGKPAGIVCIDNKVIEHCGLTIAGFPAIPWELVHAAVEAMDTKPDIVVWHGAIKEYQPFGVDLELETVWKTSFLLAALLGDLHIHEHVRDKQGRIVAYPGSTEMTKRDHRRDKYFDLYEFDDSSKPTRLPDPIAVPLDTRKVLFLRCDSEDRLVDCVTQVREAVEANPQKPPMVFLAYNWNYRDVIKRILTVIDQTTTIFRYKVLATSYGNTNYRKDTALSAQDEGFVARKPDLMAVVDRKVSPTLPLNALVRKLVNPQFNPREVLVDFVDNQLEGIDLTELDKKIESKKATT